MQQSIMSLVNAPNRFIANHHINEYCALAIMVAEFVSLYLLGLLIVVTIRNMPRFVSFVLRISGVDDKEVPQTFLELVLPMDTRKSAFATEQLHILLRSLVLYNGVWARMAGRKKLYSLELVSTHSGGIRFVLRIQTQIVDTVRRELSTYLPGIKTREIDDYLKGYTGNIRVVELELAGDYVLPLQEHKVLAEHDVMTYVINHMTGLEKDEAIAVQIVVTPVYVFTHRRIAHRLHQLRIRIALGKEVSSHLRRQRTPLARLFWFLWYPPFWSIRTFVRINWFFTELFLAIFLGYDGSPHKKGKRRFNNPYGQEVMQMVKSKTDQHLFEVAIRVLAASPKPEVVKERLIALVTSFQPFTTGYQGLCVRPNYPVVATRAHSLSRFRARTLSPHLLSQPVILSSSELADLYHFPTLNSVIENLTQSFSHTLPATPSQKRAADIDVIIGRNEHQEQQTDIGLTAAARLRHLYIIGSTGTGKTTLLEGMIYQDMLNGKGLAVLDPHGDMYRKLLAIVPEQRKRDVVVFDPSDRDFPLGLNMLDPGIHFANKEDGYSRITSSVVYIFSKLADESFWGPRMEHILRNATLTALHLPNPTLYTLQRLLTNKRFMRETVKALKDPVLKGFWQHEMLPLGESQLATTVAPLTNRLGKFMTDTMARNILLQQHTTLRLSEIMDEGKILLVNLSKGDVGEDQSYFFGTILSSLIWMAAYQRTKIPEKKRRDFYLYIDEFQNFAAPGFKDVASEGRKFHIGLTVSHQNVAQIEDQNLLKIMAGNAHTILCFRAGPHDEAFILPWMEPAVEKGAIVNLAPYHFFMKTVTDESELAFSGTTLPLEIEESEEAAQRMVAASRKQYGTPCKDVETYLEKLFGNKNSNTTANPRESKTDTSDDEP